MLQYTSIYTSIYILVSIRFYAYTNYIILILKNEYIKQSPLIIIIIMQYIVYLFCINAYSSHTRYCYFTVALYPWTLD